MRSSDRSPLAGLRRCVHEDPRRESREGRTSAVAGEANCGEFQFAVQHAAGTGRRGGLACSGVGSRRPLSRRALGLNVPLKNGIEMNTPLLGRLAFAAVVLLVLPSCEPRQGGESVAPHPGPGYVAFGEPRRVTIRGYNGDAMEPFITKNGRYLLFNDRNDPRTNTNLHFAERVDDLTFGYRGELKGVNTPALEGVPSLDREGNLFFISTRSYPETLSTLYRGRFSDGTVSGVELVTGVSRRQLGIVMFDAEISADGSTLFVVDGEFSGGPHPKTADIVIAVRDGGGFRRLPSSAELLKDVNSEALEYAPAVSSDMLELFFTRAGDLSGSAQLVIFRAVRQRTEEPFGMPERVIAITGYVEAPSLSGDGRSLYYHKLEGTRFVIYRVAR